MTNKTVWNESGILNLFLAVKKASGRKGFDILLKYIHTYLYTHFYLFLSGKKGTAICHFYPLDAALLFGQGFFPPSSESCP